MLSCRASLECPPFPPAYRGIMVTMSDHKRPAALVVVLATVVATWGLGVPASSGAPASGAPGGTDTYRYTGKSQTVVVPADINAIEVRVVGGHGGRSSGVASSTGYVGGDGAQVAGRIAVKAGQTLTVDVGGFGGDATDTGDAGAGGWGGTGNGGAGGKKGTWAGGGGGGSSMILLDGQRLIVSGGGGGAGGGGFIDPADAGAPGGSTGVTVDAGHDGHGPGSGKGGGGGGNGGKAAGGGGGDGKHLGGGGGGGGAGVVGGAGGGGGGAGGGGGGGGGGGTSFVSPQVELASLTRSVDAGNNGIISVTWEHLDAPQCAAQTIDVAHASPGVLVQLHCADVSRPASFQLRSGPSHGKLVGFDVAKGTFTYVPAVDYAGTDTVTFAATAVGQVSADTTVTFLNAPECFDLTIGVGSDGPGASVQLRCSATNEPWSLKLVGLPKHGYLDNRDLVAGTFTYVPAEGYVGTDSMTFDSVSQGFASLPATVTFRVATRSPAPMTLTASSAEVTEGQAPTLTVKLPTDASGQVGFYDEAQPGTDKGIGTADIVNGVAMLSAPTRVLGVGTHDIHASFGGDNLYAANDSNVVTVTVETS
jgi:hypothetical protein